MKLTSIRQARELLELWSLSEYTYLPTRQGHCSDGNVSVIAPSCIQLLLLLSLGCLLLLPLSLQLQLSSLAEQHSVAVIIKTQRQLCVRQQEMHNGLPTVAAQSSQDLSASQRACILSW